MTSETISHIISSVSAAVVAISSAIAAGFAVGGINAYRRQLRAKDHYELAKRLSLAVCKVFEGFAYVRNPLIRAEEMDDCRENSRDYEKEAYAYANRLKVLMDGMSNLESEMMQANLNNSG